MGKIVTISGFLKSKRVAAKLSQSDVAKKLGYSSAQFVSNWERGIAKPPTSSLREIAKLYHVPEEQMLRLAVTEMEHLVTKEFYSKTKNKR
jgi:transcriptional regulator with XRE-family HTH domain